MLNDKIKEEIQKYILDELDQEKKLEITALINSSGDARKYYELSKLTWDKLDEAAKVEPNPNYISNFWNTVAQQPSSGFDFFGLFKNRFAYVGSFAVFCIISVFIINMYLSNNGVSLTDEEILVQFEDSLAVSTDSSLDVFGPWEDFSQEL